MQGASTRPFFLFYLIFFYYYYFYLEKCLTAGRCPGNQICTNTNTGTGFTCSCGTGLVLAADGVNCVSKFDQWFSFFFFMFKNALMQSYICPQNLMMKIVNLKRTNFRVNQFAKIVRKSCRPWGLRPKLIIHWCCIAYCYMYLIRISFLILFFYSYFLLYVQILVTT